MKRLLPLLLIFALVAGGFLVSQSPGGIGSMIPCIRTPVGSFGSCTPIVISSTPATTGKGQSAQPVPVLKGQTTAVPSTTKAQPAPQAQTGKTQAAPVQAQPQGRTTTAPAQQQGGGINFNANQALATVQGISQTKILGLGLLSFLVLFVIVWRLYSSFSKHRKQGTLLDAGMDIILSLLGLGALFMVIGGNKLLTVLQSVLSGGSFTSISNTSSSWISELGTYSDLKLALLLIIGAFLILTRLMPVFETFITEIATTLITFGIKGILLLFSVAMVISTFAAAGVSLTGKSPQISADITNTISTKMSLPFGVNKIIADFVAMPFGLSRQILMIALIVIVLGIWLWTKKGGAAHGEE